MRIEVKNYLPDRIKRNRLFFLSLFVSISLYSIFINPMEFSPVSCQYKSLTNHECLSCGISRSFHSAANFNFQDAFTYNPFGLILFVLMIFLSTKYSIELLLKKEIRLNLSPVIVKAGLLAACLVLLVYWINK
ncbi:MAG: DUF2752 domain-containing protein [Melioribacteraceae bacterium]|nr:DUF2752 domain-containing protein [Melioribacteraceae bacterium]MCF8354704.1 DUF2752 domain-containing protein [Melioribacteraceae bacterium]MCF8393606.1 DUF2752 domain-containing protein [Melioribacteraceae bacterium]MCF8419416.1 DUF2752 domain-containing protein [Melioribacteraceae bacterium]